MGMVRFGVCKTLDDAATELIRQSLEGVTSMSAKSDILTPWKEQDRRNREVYSASGIADPAIRKGIYHRTAIPKEEPGSHRNSRDGVTRGSRTGTLADFVDSQHREGESRLG